MKNKLFMIACLVFLAACAGGGRGRADVAVYDLGPASVLQRDAAGPFTGVALDVRLPAWLDGLAMSYRLAYADPLRLHSYSQARWAASPALMLRQRLRQQLALSPSGAPCVLRIEIDDFSQTFVGPADSRAVLHGEALLFDNGRTPKVRQSLSIEIAAVRGDAAGGAAALAVAADRLGATLAQWLGQQNLAACRVAG